jgi:phage shock protein PspC (stress-responsive transcriptional regulator)
MAAKRPRTPSIESVDEADGTEATDPVNEPSPPTSPESTPIPEGGAERRFFTWMRGLGIVRQPGWIGGVCAGIADRLGIDPLIVRGIAVVVAVLGGPALLLYAAAWLLLPDHKNSIHLEQVLRGRFEAPTAGIGVLILLSTLPITQGFWFAGAEFWGEPSWDLTWGRTLWTVIVLGAIVALIILFSRRASHSEPRVSPATTDDRPDTIPQPAREDTVASVAHISHAVAESVASLRSDAQGAERADQPPPPPAAARVDASAEELSAWREQQALWKHQNAAWRAQQSATERELRLRRAAEARERAVLRAVEAAERRRQLRLANPRITAAVGWCVLGAAIVSGGIAGLVAMGDPSVAGYELTIGLAAAAITLGVAIVGAGALRRRSGILSFLAVLVLLGLLASALLPQNRHLFFAYGQLGAGGDARYAQVIGSLDVSVNGASPTGVTDIWQGSGTIRIVVAEGAAAHLEIISRSEQIYVYEYVSSDEMDWRPAASQTLIDGMWHATDTVGDGGEAVTIRIWQGNGNVVIDDMNEFVEGATK